METRRLEVLVALSRLGSMRAVADALGSTTSTVSQQVAALAREVGTPLVEPDGRRVRLTPAGRRLAQHAVGVLAAVEAARLDLDPGADPVGTVCVAGFATAVRDALLPMVRDLGRTHPRVRLLVREHEPDEALALLADDGVDLALVYDYEPGPDQVRGRPAGDPPRHDGVGAGRADRLGARGQRRRGGLPAPRRPVDRELAQHRRRGRRAAARLARRLRAGRRAPGRQPRAWCSRSWRPGSAWACCPRPPRHCRASR
ncbi:hypothetical protein GCM10025868_25640 [Angustibacter aerolatus]|uniref:HTH lysR-type domain-containing protein n=1 Tax=Angustibacter aerolatus TaxID=1162965 RepID=A0ABQ6JHL0_9ACTN|nr:LysR family transcriptional regulator [Angustibacter aerolatus]GMA87314.1 hypothetical protein GCM10025868_25640 [Angustibacter aerolatus]